MPDQMELSPAQSLLEEMLRDALAHLYDAPQLQLHPLTQLLAHGDRADGPTRLTSHRLMLEAMERLRPLARIGAADPAWRPYFALHSRYVEGMELAQIAEEQGVSMRQLRREHARGMAALASVVWTDFLTAPQRQYLEAMRDEPPLADAPTAHMLDEQGEAHADAPSQSHSQSHLDLELSRLSIGQATPNGISLHEAIDGVVATLTDLLARQGVELTLDLPASSAAVEMDRVVLRQVLLNVLIHLLEQSLEQRMSDKIVLRARESRDMWEVSLLRRQVTGGAHPACAEGGIGDPKRSVETVTNLLSVPGSQSITPLDSQTVMDRVNIAEQLLSLQGGELLWEAGPEVICRLRLPLHHAPVVLIIDDNPDLISLFRRYLADVACRVVGVHESRRAFDVAQELQPQAIVLDVMMPEQDGWELLQRFRVQPETKDIPIVVCSVLREETLARSLGASSFVAKPVTQQALKAVLVPWLTG